MLYLRYFLYFTFPFIYVFILSLFSTTHFSSPHCVVILMTFIVQRSIDDGYTGRIKKKFGSKIQKPIRSKNQVSRNNYNFINNKTYGNIDTCKLLYRG